MNIYGIRPGDLLRDLQQLRGGVLKAAGREGRTLVIAATIAMLASDYTTYLTGEVVSISSQRA